MRKIGKRIFYDNRNGAVLAVVGERSGHVRSTTVEEDIESFPILMERVRESFDYIDLEYGQFSEDFRQSTSFVVDVESKEIVFNYEGKDDEPKFRAPLSVEVRNLSRTVSEMDEILIELIFDNTINKF